MTSLLEEAAVAASRARPNWLLSALGPTGFATVADSCQVIRTHVEATLWEPDRPIEHVYFPTSGCLSVISVLDDDVSVEVGTVGWEGMAGLSLLHGIDRVATKCIVQVSGSALRMSTAQFTLLLATNPSLLRLMHLYAQFWSEQSARSIACNGAHSVDQRCARWLLMTEDRVGEAKLPLSHKFLSIMLGVRRASVSVAAKSLQDAGLITYTRGKINVIDRPGLMAASCSCYAAISKSYSSLLPEAALQGVHGVSYFLSND